MHAQDYRVRKLDVRRSFICFGLAWALVLVLSLVAGMAEASPRESRDPQTFDARDLKVTDFIGTLLIEPGDQATIAVVLSGKAEDLDAISLSHADDVVVVKGGKNRRDLRGFRRWFDSSPLDGDLDDYPVMSIVVPRGGMVKVTDTIGALRIGDTEGTLVLDSVSVDGTVGRMREASIGIAGSGELELDSVLQDMSVAIAGSGSIDAGAVGGEARVSVAGSGEARVGAVGGGLGVSISGSGDVSVDTVAGPVRVSISGSGDVRVDNGRADPLKVSINGSGDFRFGGVAVNPKIAVNGSGDIFLGGIEGQLKSSGNGDIQIGQ